MGSKRMIAAALLIGFLIAMVLMGVWIYFGYYDAYRTDAAQYTIRLLGLPIYRLTWSGTNYSAAAIGPNMGLVCAACMLLALIAERLFHRLHRP